MEGNALKSRIALDRYVYEDIYPAFKATTDEKDITARINSAFLNYLAQRKVTLSGDSAALVADIGCGPCDTLIKYLTGVNFAPGFILRATDFLPAYADAERGEALQRLAAAQTSGIIKVESFAARAGDAFGGKLLDLLTGPHDGSSMRNAFRVVFASHVMYHADGPAQVRRFVEDVANHLLSRDGVCIMYHIANAPRTFQDFRARFGSEAGKTRDSDTGAVSIDDPPAQIAEACAAAGAPIYQAPFITRLFFSALGDAEWRAFKDPHSYDALADSNPAAYEDLKRLYFIVQRAPLEFAADHSRSGLATYVDEARGVIDGNRGMLPSSERMQVFSRADAPPNLARVISEAIAAAMASLA